MRLYVLQTTTFQQKVTIFFGIVAWGITKYRPWSTVAINTVSTLRIYIPEEISQVWAGIFKKSRLSYFYSRKQSFKNKTLLQYAVERRTQFATKVNYIWFSKCKRLQVKNITTIILSYLIVSYLILSYLIFSLLFSSLVFSSLILSYLIYQSCYKTYVLQSYGFLNNIYCTKKKSQKYHARLKP
jgi:hypothetical protein